MQNHESLFEPHSLAETSTPAEPRRYSEHLQNRKSLTPITLQNRKTARTVTAQPEHSIIEPRRCRTGDMTQKRREPQHKIVTGAPDWLGTW